VRESVQFFSYACLRVCVYMCYFFVCVLVHVEGSSMLQCVVAVRCSVLQCFVAVCCSMLQCVIPMEVAGSTST